jgi:hypothetical protein
MRGVFNDPIKGFGVMRDYAFRRAAFATGIAREKSRFTLLDPALKPQAAIFEDATRDLASAVDRILRKHGKNIIGKQFASKRLANIMTDLFVMACVLSRVNSAVVEKGASESLRELELLKMFCNAARRRVKSNHALIDDNDDELIKSLASHAFEAERYVWDVI